MLGQQPNRVQATDRPTTHPIVASVAGTVPAPQPDDGSLASPTPPPSTNHKKPSAIHPASPPTNVVTDDDTSSPPMREAEPTAAGERSLVRALGLKIGRIVIDAGHGGHDSGTVGPGGIQEKEIVLDVALRLGKLLKQRLGADVIFTRDNDTFIPLETRTAIANKAQADLFLSIHANSSSDSSARGVETYYLNFTTSPDALEVAARENAVSNESIHELSDLVKKITLKDKIDESREFAADVQKSLYDDLEDGNPGLRDRGVKKAPFVVLIGANMPSILAEISFLTNSDDAREMQQPAYRQRIAESLYRGVSRYISGLSGIRLAQNLGRPTGN
jgi:N-acetylmuramoyl-L-alanine amidase